MEDFILHWLLAGYRFVLCPPLLLGGQRIDFARHADRLNPFCWQHESLLHSGIVVRTHL
jgi:hypothetical protein